EALEPRREGEDVEGGEQVRYVRALAEQLDRQPRGQPLQVRAQLSITRDRDPDVTEDPRRLHQRPLPFLLGKARDVADERAVLLQRGPPVREPLEIDPERDDVARPTPVAPAIRLRRVDHLGPCRPAEPPPGATREV